MVSRPQLLKTLPLSLLTPELKRNWMNPKGHLIFRKWNKGEASESPNRKKALTNRILELGLSPMEQRILPYLYKILEEYPVPPKEIPDYVEAIYIYYGPTMRTILVDLVARNAVKTHDTIELDKAKKILLSLGYTEEKGLEKPYIASKLLNLAYKPHYLTNAILDEVNLYYGIPGITNAYPGLPKWNPRWNSKIKQRGEE